MKPRQKCKKCQSPVDPDTVKYRKTRNWEILCKDCHKEDIAKRKEKRRQQRIRKLNRLKALFSLKKCVCCGGPIKWKDSYYNKTISRWPSTCCPTCHGIYSKRHDVYPKDAIIDKIKTFIEKKGRFVSYKEVIKDLKISSKVLSKHHISISALNKEVLGIAVNKYANECPAISTASLKELGLKYGKLCTTHAELLKHCRSIGIDTYDVVYSICMSAIAANGAYTGVTFLMKDLGVSFEYLREHHKLDIISMNKAIGFVDKKSSWYERITNDKLVELLGEDKVSRDHVFPECRSTKNYPLRFDFYLPYHSVIIEVDGEQHTDINNAYHKESLVTNDSIKNKYAEDKGIALYRISTKPRHTFIDRLNTLILDVLKPIELLETLADKAEGNQQPSCSNTEGSETIETYLF